MLEGFHDAIENSWDNLDWRIPEFNSHTIIFDVVEVYEKCNDVITINLDQIAWKGKHIKNSCRGERYDNCDISFPPIVTKATNPFSLPFRCIDGKHRLSKMRDMGYKTVLCNYITPENLKSQGYYKLFE